MLLKHANAKSKLPAANFFFPFWLIYGAPFARLLDSFDVKFINSRLVTNNNSFDEWLHYQVFLLRPLFDVVFQNVSDLLVRVWPWYASQTINQNVLSWSTTDVEILCYLSNANTTIVFFDVIVINKVGWPAWRKFSMTTFTESSRASIGNTQISANSLLIFFSW